MIKQCFFNNSAVSFRAWKTHPAWCSHYSRSLQRSNYLVTRHWLVVFKDTPPLTAFDQFFSNGRENWAP